MPLGMRISREVWSAQRHVEEEGLFALLSNHSDRFLGESFGEQAVVPLF